MMELNSQVIDHTKRLKCDQSESLAHKAYSKVGHVSHLDKEIRS
jgi:hypothetical protein